MFELKESSSSMNNQHDNKENNLKAKKTNSYEDLNKNKLITHIATLKANTRSKSSPNTSEFTEIVSPRKSSSSRSKHISQLLKNSTFNLSNENSIIKKPKPKPKNSKKKKENNSNSSSNSNKQEESKKSKKKKKKKKLKKIKINLFLLFQQII